MLGVFNVCCVSVTRSALAVGKDQFNCRKGCNMIVMRCYVVTRVEEQ